MKKFKTNSFYVLAEKYRKAITDEHERRSYPSWQSEVLKAPLGVV